ncbi:hypothetical protein J7643_06870 [bacterium]|nr:hypothetical protein [bacterium]
MHLKARRGLLVSLSAALLMAGCGQGPAKIATTSTDTFDALTTKGLREGFKALHNHIFDLVDTNQDRGIDEAEASRYFDMTTEFPVLSRSVGVQRGNGRISRSEFLMHATRGAFLGSLDTPKVFAQRTRTYLTTYFDRLDRPVAANAPKGDEWLTYAELADPMVAELGMSFVYEKFRLRVTLSAFDPADVVAVDLNKDGRLSRAEFEDLYMTTVFRQVRAAYPVGTPGVAPTPTPQPTLRPAPLPTPTADPCPACPPPEY